MLIHNDYLFVSPFWFVAVLTITLPYIRWQYLSILTNICHRFDQSVSPFWPKCVTVLTKMCRRFDQNVSPFWPLGVAVLTKDVAVLVSRSFGSVAINDHYPAQHNTDLNYRQLNEWTSHVKTQDNSLVLCWMLTNAMFSCVFLVLNLSIISKCQSH